MTDQDKPYVRYEISGGAATITLDSPHNRNAISTRLVTELQAGLTSLPPIRQFERWYSPTPVEHSVREPISVRPQVRPHHRRTPSRSEDGGC